MSVTRASQANVVSDADLLDIAMAAAREGAGVVRAADSSRLRWTEKGTADFVTDTDREAEAKIGAVIGSHIAGARIIGEELSPGAEDLSGLTFIVDPIDGTTNFLHGYPEYAVSIGVARDGEPVAAAVLNVTTGELFSALRGQGARRDGNPIRVSAISEPSRALIGTGFPFKHRHFLPAYLQQLETVVRSSAGVRRAGSAALDLANVACGRFDGFWELMLAPWDVAAGILIVREAGGVVTDLSGRDAALEHAAIVAANPALHGWLVDILAGPNNRQ